MMLRKSFLLNFRGSKCLIRDGEHSPEIFPACLVSIENSTEAWSNSPSAKLAWVLELRRKREDMSGKFDMKLTVMPAGHGDCVLVQCGDFNIMVDSGPYAAAISKRVRAGLLNSLGGRPIHLAIVTHYDDDHIGGLSRALEDSALPIQALLFNSPLRISEYIDRHRYNEADVSVRQALHVAGELTPYNPKVILAGQQYKFYDERIVLKVLSPSGKDVLHYGKRMLAAIGGLELAGRRGRCVPVCGRINELLAMHDDDQDADTSETNALSLAFILTFDGRSILFLGDSWPSVVTGSLALMRSDEERIPLDLAFVSHHGSKNNNTVELYRHINTAHYVVSADGKQNPDVETFGRILRAAAPNQPTFHFSEKSTQLDTMFEKSDLDIRFPENGPLTIIL